MAFTFKNSTAINSDSDSHSDGHNLEQEAGVSLVKVLMPPDAVENQPTGPRSSVSMRDILADQVSGVDAAKSNLLALPSELIGQIIAFLGPADLASFSKTCRILLKHGDSEVYWQRLIQDSVPGIKLASSSPCRSYKDLYISHDPHWFLPKHKIWFSDHSLTGKIIIARFDPRRGCIEAYQLVAECDPPVIDTWTIDTDVKIHSFRPHVRLHLDQPVLKFDALSLESMMISSGRVQHSSKFSGEVPMRDERQSRHGIFTNFLLTRPVEPHSNMALWPPLTIPASHRVRNASQSHFLSEGHKPHKRSEISDQSFRIRKWMQMVHHGFGIHLGETVDTYATLRPELYTPTEAKPWRGIWVGDYSGHGCEFLLLHQPDDEIPFDPKNIIQAEDETPEEFEARKVSERIYRGSLKAIKLTGDINVPRGEYTVIAEDLSKILRTATEEPFLGAKVVEGKGHIAGRMFKDDAYIDAQIIMISPNKIALHWVEFGHINYFEKVDIDQFITLE